MAVVAHFPEDDPDDLDCYREGKVFLVCSSSLSFKFSDNLQSLQYLILHYHSDFFFWIISLICMFIV